MLGFNSKSFVIAAFVLFVIYTAIDMIFIRGSLVATYHGKVIVSWSNSDYRFRGGPWIAQATIKLDDGSFVNGICEGLCSVGNRVTVEEFKPLIGWGSHYYIKSAPG